MISRQPQMHRMKFDLKSETELVQISEIYLTKSHHLIFLT